MDQDLVKVTEIFLMPASILVGALSVAGTEPLKTGVSLVSFVASLMWLVCVVEAAPADPLIRERMLCALPLLFLVATFVSCCVHGWWWLQATRMTREHRAGMDSQ
jgi:hypothetical protein